MGHIEYEACADIRPTEKGTALGNRILRKIGILLLATLIAGGSLYGLYFLPPG